jgi:hypothetical protein
VKRQLGAMGMATLVLVAAACGSDNKASRAEPASVEAADGPATSVSASARPAADESFAAAAATTFAPAPAEAEARAAETAAPSAPGSQPAAPLGGVVAPPVGNQIREASIAIAVPTSDFDQAQSEVASIATIVGGFVASSDATISDRTDKNRAPATASMVIRVPSASFEEVRTKLSRLGTVTAINFSGQEVSAQLVDLDARIKILQGQEDAYNDLLRQAKTIPDIINMTNEVTAVRTEIEQLKASQASLKDRVALSTFTVRLDEVIAAEAPKAKPVVAPPAKDDRGRFEKVWEESTDALAAIVMGVGIVLVALAPFAAALSPFALLAWLLSRRSARRRYERRDAALVRDGGHRDPLPSPSSPSSPSAVPDASRQPEDEPAPVG